MLLLFRKRKVVSDTFNRDNGALTGWDYTNNAWAIASNAAVCTPPLGAELFVNGAFAADTDWTKGTGWTIGSGVATKTAGTASALTQAVGTLNRWGKSTYDLTRTAGGVTSQFGNKQGVTHSVSESVISTNRVGANTNVGINGNSTFAGTVDNASTKLMVTSDLLATRGNFSANASIAANMTVNSDTLAGVVGWVDSYTNPQNFVILTHNGTAWVLDKLVGGAYGFITGGSVAAVAGAEIKMVGVRSGANLLVTCYYNGNAIGTTQTVSDAGIVSNRRHGLFSTSEMNSFDSVSIR